MPIISIIVHQIWKWILPILNKFILKCYSRINSMCIRRPIFWITTDNIIWFLLSFINKILISTWHRFH